MPIPLTSPACQDDGKHKFSYLRLSGRRQTQIFASPVVTATPNDVYTEQVTSTACQDRPNTNFRISACHRYPMGRLHNQLASRRPCAQQLLQKALYTAPAARTPTAGQAATTCAAAPPAGPVYCACHTNASRRPAGDHARSNSSRLCVTRLPHEIHSRAMGASRRPRAQQLLQKALHNAPATRKPAAGHAGQPATTRAAARPDGAVYCACHTKGSRGPAAPTRAAASPGGSVYCACHTTAWCDWQVVWWVVLWWVRCDEWGVMGSAVMIEVRWVVLWWVRCEWVRCDEWGTRRRADAEAAWRLPSEK